MTTLILTLLFACGDKEEETDSATEEVVEEVAEESTEEEAEDTAVSEEE
jgi:hypothetical protein|tara:strand:- start:1519 stop:1665 length:147 start_codon:yes stop_codon:yes gene_type:complete